MLLLGAFGLSARFNRTVRKVFSFFIPHIYHVFRFRNSNCLIIRLLYVTYSVIDWRNIYNIHHAIPHDLGLSITFFCWSLCKRNRIRLRVKQVPCRCGESGHETYRFVSQDETKCFSAWNEQFHGMKQSVSSYETITFLWFNDFSWPLIVLFVRRVDSVKTYL